MAEQSQFLGALGVTVDGIPVDDAALPSAPARVPNAAGTNNYLYSHESQVTGAEYSAQIVAEERATFDGQAVRDFHNRGERVEADREEDEDGRDNDDISEDAWYDRIRDAGELLGEGQHPDYGDYEGESSASSMADSMDGYSPPERILCQSDQDFSRRGYLFLVKWEGCSILRSSWEWEKPRSDYRLGSPRGTPTDPRRQDFLQLPHPIRKEWEERKERIGRGEEKKFDVHKWKRAAEEEEAAREMRRVLRRWKRSLEGIKRVLETEKMDAEGDWHEDMMERIDREDREDKFKGELEKSKQKGKEKAEERASSSERAGANDETKDAVMKDVGGGCG